MSDLAVACKTGCLGFDIVNHNRYWRQRWASSCSRSASRGRVERLCKVIQRVMREEQATTDSRFSRYVGHTGGGLFCIFSLPCLFLCCLPLSRLHLISYSLTPFISAYLSVLALLFISFLVFWQTTVTVSHYLGQSGGKKKSKKRDQECETLPVVTSFYRLACFFKPLLCLIKGLPVAIFPSAFATYAVNCGPSFLLPSPSAFWSSSLSPSRSSAPKQMASCSLFTHSEHSSCQAWPRPV